jgi:diguanylate cyclase (GGDEF)-like protein/PAS domain S-box-containing protein
LTTKHVARLGGAFAVLIAIVLAVGHLGLRRMQAIDATLSDITGSKSIDLELARRAMAISNDNNRIVMEIVLVENRRLVEPLLAARSQNSKELTELIEQSESRCQSEKEKQVMSEVKRTRKPYLESCQRAIHLLVDERKHDEAETFMVEDTLPALHAYQAAWEKFVEFQKEELEAAVKHAQVDYAKARRLASLVIGLAVVLAGVIALFATRETAHEMAARIDAEKELSKLNAGLEERVIQRTSELSETIQHINLQAAALGAVANAIAVTDFRGTIQWVNHAFTTMTGYSAEEVVGKNHRLLKSGKQSQSFYADLWSTVSSGKVWHGELINRRKDGTTYIEEQTITPLAQNVGEAIWTHFVAIKQDITERKRAEEMLRNNENKYRALFEDSADANWLLDEKGFLACNLAALQMFGYTNVAEMKHPVDISPPNQPDGRSSQTVAEEKIAAAFLHGKERFEWLHQRKDGNVFPAEVCLTALTLGGQPTLLATVRDISDRKLAEERVQFLAYYDALTRLPNRTLLRDRLAKALAGAGRHKEKVALLFLDLDKFKDINDSFGHEVGDLLLQGVGERLKTWGREQDTVARLGGDEFLIMLTDVKDVPDVAVATERLMDAMTAEFVLQGHPFNVSCSIGISIFPEHGADCETLIKNADAAMYSAKAHGRNNFRFFTDDMNAQAVERLTLENSLRSALAKEELFLMYQPQMDIATGRITGLEALLRWQHPELGLVPPDKFIRIAENSGLIVPIGEWVLRTACSQARKWQNEGLHLVTVAVNVSAVQFRQEGFCELIRRVLHETGLAAQYLELELTESLLLANADVTLSVFLELESMGLTLAIDDFGTGYSNFTSLRQFGVSKLKIDRSFISAVATNPDYSAITTAIISMAKSLHLKVIAEGVEDEAQLSFLRAHHCDEMQGYYFSKPLMVDKVADKLRGDSPELHARAQASGAQS